MKKVGDYAVRGNIDSGDVAKIQLFDGNFDTAFRVVSVRCAVSDLSSANEAYLVVSTEPTGNAGDQWDWSSNLEIGWAYFKTSLGANEGSAFYSNVDDDNMVVEDLYLQALADSGTVNYEIRLERYEITEWQGALSLVRNASQG